MPLESGPVTTFINTLLVIVLAVAVAYGNGVFGWNRKSRGRRMEYDDYLRDQAARYRLLAEETGDLEAKQELFALAAVCDEAANNYADRLTAG